MPATTVLPPDIAATADGLKPAGWWHESDSRAQVVCDLCPRGCALAEGARGFCFVRQNRQGQMVTTTYGRSTGFCIDPIEKKPLNHFYPGSAVLSFGTAGCNLGCKFCQNWEISKSRESDALCERADPEAVARVAQKLGCRSVAFTYNDPVVWAEYAIDCAKACRAAGVKTVAVTAGYITPLARKTFFAAIDAANVDLKGFSEEFYRDLTGSHIAPVQDTLRWLARETDVWLELTTLLIPGRNDSAEELTRMCAWLVEALGPDVPIHFTAFHPDFRLRDIPPTPPATLIKAREIAIRAGLKYAYTGNLRDYQRQSTYCPGCGQIVIGRSGYDLTAYNLEQNRCRGCGTTIAGRFAAGPGQWGPRCQRVRIADYDRIQDGLAAGRQLSDERSVRAASLPTQVAGEAIDLTPEQERLVFAAAGRRVLAEVMGERPAAVEQSLAGLAAKTVCGVFVTLRREGMLRGCCGCYGQMQPLGQAIEHAAVAAARHDRRFPPIEPIELPYLHMDVTLLSRIEPVTAAGRERRKAVIVGTHGLRIERGGRQGLLLPVVAVEHGLDAEGFLELVCRKAGLPTDAWVDDATLLATFHGHAIAGELKTLRDDQGRPLAAELPRQRTAAEVARPEGGTNIRLPAVAGTFYPRGAEEIDRTLDTWLAGAPEPEPWAGALVPHAGWMYSGRLAAEVFRRVRFPRRVIILAPKHRPEGAGWAVAPHAIWQLPGGGLNSDPELARGLAAAIPGLELDAAAHAFEHAIEVQLPFIARLAPQARVVGITVGASELADLQRFGRQMAGVLAGLDERPLLVVSSDMNHFADDTETRRRDRLALDALESLDPERLYRTVRDNGISMCGAAGAVVALTALGCLNALSGCCEVGYTTSAAASGDTRRCVGYAGLLFK